MASATSRRSTTSSTWRTTRRCCPRWPPTPASGGAGARPASAVFFEIKANVSRAQVAALVDAGITWVQPGIESLHSEVLKLMDKGIQGWQNVQLLKWARELGLRLSWSVLWGFPGEKDDWYGTWRSGCPR